MPSPSSSDSTGCGRSSWPRPCPHRSTAPDSKWWSRSRPRIRTRRGRRRVLALIEAAVHRIDPGALLGGVPAENLAIQHANAHDTKLIIPLVLGVVFVILCVLLIAVAAPLYLIATVVASFAATLGLVTLLFSHLFGHEGLAFNLELISFIFLVALGVDYNIFLMDRVRDEARMWGTREGTLRALNEYRGRRHQRRDHPRRHVRVTDTAAAGAAGSDRRDRLARGADRRVRGAGAAGPVADLPDRRSRLVAVRRPDDGNGTGGRYWSPVTPCIPTGTVGGGSLLARLHQQSDSLLRRAAASGCL